MAGPHETLLINPHLGTFFPVSILLLWIPGSDISNQGAKSIARGSIGSTST